MAESTRSGASTVFWSCRVGARLLILVVAFCFVPGLVEAHIPSTEATVGFRFPVLVVGSAVVGSLGGFGVVVARVRRSSIRFGQQQFTGVLGVGLSVLGISLLLSLAFPKPVLTIGFAALGLLGAGGLSVRPRTTDERTTALSTTGAVMMHQSVEGMALAGAYLAGGVVGVAAAVFLTLHTVAETAVVAGTHLGAADSRSAITAVVSMQIVYMTAAGVAFATAWSIPVFVQDVAAGGAGAVLLAVGLHECWSVIAGQSVS